MRFDNAEQLQLILNTEMMIKNTYDIYLDYILLNLDDLKIETLQVFLDNILVEGFSKNIKEIEFSRFDHIQSSIFSLTD